MTEVLVPAYTKADDTLHFMTGDVHISEIVKYENYKRFGSKTEITTEGKELPPGEKKGSDTARAAAKIVSGFRFE